LDHGVDQILATEIVLGSKAAVTRPNNGGTNVVAFANPRPVVRIVLDVFVAMGIGLRTATEFVENIVIKES